MSFYPLLKEKCVSHWFRKLIFNRVVSNPSDACDGHASVWRGDKDKKTAPQQQPGRLQLTACTNNKACPPLPPHPNTKGPHGMPHQLDKGSAPSATSAVLLLVPNKMGRIRSHKTTVVAEGLPQALASAKGIAGATSAGPGGAPNKRCRR